MEASAHERDKAKKKLRRRIIAAVVLVLLIGTAATLFLLRPKDAAFTEETAKSGDIATYYSFGGNIEAKERQSVLADTMMQIKTLKVKEGDAVKKGDVLAETTMGGKIQAKIDGEITTIYVEESAQLMAGAPVMDLVNYDELQVTIKVDEYDLGTIQAGKAVTATINALDKDVKGTVSKVSREAVTMNGVSYFTASVDLEKDASLLVGMSAEVKLLNQEVKGVATLSMKALQFDNENKPYVYVKNAEGKTVAKAVTVGINDGVTVEIKDGVKAGDTVFLPKTGFTFPMMGHRGDSEDKG